MLSAKAYVFNGYTVPNHNYVTYYVYSSFSPYVYDFNTYSVKWNTSPKITILPSSGVNATISVEGDLMSSNIDAYGVTYHHTNGTGTIIFYHNFTGLTTVEKHETIIHEVGHVLGLAHCQPSKNSVSVMRQYGFNHVETPLSDDWAGINALY